MFFKNSEKTISDFNKTIIPFIKESIKKKKTIISNFPIPTTKNDILEFLSLAIPNAKKAGNFFTSGSFNSPANHRNKLHNDFVTVWKAKCEQIIMKARFTMKEDKKTLEQIERYAKEIGL